MEVKTKVVLAAGLLIAAISGVANSAEPAPPDVDRERVALELIKASGWEAGFSASLQAMRPAWVKSWASGGYIPVDEATKMYDTVFVPDMNNHKGELLAASARIYAEHYSVAEMKEMVAFYLTPTGRKVVANQSIIAGECAEAQESLMRDVMRHLAELANKYKTEKKTP